MELIVLFSPISDAAAFVAADGIGWEQPTVRLDHRPYDKWLCWWCPLATRMDRGSFVIGVVGPISSGGVRTRSLDQLGTCAAINLHYLPIVTWLSFLYISFFHSFPGCRTCRPTLRASNGARWTDRPAARVTEAIAASYARLPPNTSISGGGYRITTFSGRQWHRRRPPCTLRSPSWLAMLK